MVGAELGLPQRQRLFAELEGLGRPAEGEVALGQVVQDAERVGVVGAEPGLPQQRLFAELGGPRPAGRGSGRSALGQVLEHARKRVGVVGTELGLPQRERLLGELECIGVPAEEL